MAAGEKNEKGGKLNQKERQGLKKCIFLPRPQQLYTLKEKMDLKGEGEIIEMYNILCIQEVETHFI